MMTVRAFDSEEIGPKQKENGCFEAIPNSMSRLDLSQTPAAHRFDRRDKFSSGEIMDHHHRVPQLVCAAAGPGSDVDRHNALQHPSRKHGHSGTAPFIDRSTVSWNLLPATVT
ncbi:hypothetical protein ACTZWT_00440 [Rhodopseudomonas sp. NSM]|uniref:hypothetical protein n=1 Tax=Rhodopseudomonas sp. NSM TaxID=3457630 RepID=UPI00403558AB